MKVKLSISQARELVAELQWEDVACQLLLVRLGTALHSGGEIVLDLSEDEVRLVNYLTPGMLEE